jgi:hypothetical protein
MIRLACVIGLAALVLAGCASQSDGATSSSGGKPAKPVVASAQVPQAWVHYTDTAEGAFSMDVPAGWQVQGGMWRFGYFDVRWMMTVRSLDGAMLVRVDDVSVPPYVLPGPYTGTQGQTYSKPQQFQMVVSDYRTGEEYAKLYGPHRFKSVCTTMAVQSGKSWSPALPALFAASPAAQHVTSGSITYGCLTSAGPRLAIVYARTTQYPAGSSPGFWVVDPLISILTTPKDANVAYAVAQRMLNSWQKNPKWAAYQNQLTQVGLNQIMSNFQSFMSQMQAYDQARRQAMDSQVAGFESRMNAQSAQVNSFCETLTGIQNVTDPESGAQFQVWMGPKSNYYSNGSTTINSDISPGLGFHQVSTGP